MKRMIWLFAATLALIAASPSSAATRSDVYNGATCISYPPFDRVNAVPYSFVLLGFRERAFCHFTIPDDWTAGDVSYVLFHGLANPGAGPLRVRLCFYNAIGASTSCGAERTIPENGDFSTNWVAPPADMPSSPMGGYLQVSFPTDRVSMLAYFVPVFYRP